MLCENQATNSKSLIPIITAIDLFCGVGGLTYGLEQAGINVTLGVDCDSDCEYPYKMNTEASFLNEYVENLDSKYLNKYLKSGEYKLLAGCAPCQTFSTYNPKAKKKDTRWRLLLQFSRLIQEIKPDIVTMENVPKLTKHEVFNSFIQTLEDIDYSISYKVVNCSDYGIPQNRRRLVLLASRLGKIDLLTPEKYIDSRKTVRDVIRHLPKIEAGEVCKDDLLHQSARLTEKNLKRIKSSRQGGTWRDWEDKLVANCHKKSSGKTYPSVYGRMSWDKPSPTITTQFYGFGNGRFGHPEQDRAISLREGAILQSFPDSYRFIDPESTFEKRAIGRLIGNAVPPVLGRIIGESITKHLITIIES